MSRDRIINALACVFAGLFLICIPAAGSGVMIDPLPDQVILTDELKVTGTAPAGKEFIIENYLRKGYCSGAEDEAADPGYYERLKGMGGAFFTIKAKEDSTWEFTTGIAISAPGDYTFVARAEGDEDNRIVKNVRISYAPAGVRTIEVYEPGADGPVFDTASAEESNHYTQNTYTTPGSGMNLIFTPDLPTTGGTISKGKSLAIGGQAVAGKDLLVWIYRISDSGSYVYSRIKTPETDDKGIIIADGQLLSGNETKELLSGKYFIIAVSGTKDELSGIEDRIMLRGPSYFFANEDKNPFQRFVFILEEPWIGFSGTSDGKLPDTAGGSTLSLEGTTNLRPGSDLVLTVKPPGVSNPGNFTGVVTGIHVKAGEPCSWSAEYETPAGGTGWFTVSVSDPQGTAGASALVNIYDPVFGTGDADESSLLVRSFSIDPETKDIRTKSPPLNTTGAVPVAVILFETGLVFAISVCAVVIYKKR